MENEKKFEIANVENSVFQTFDNPDDAPILRDSTTTETETLFNAVNGASIKVKDVLGETLSITDIVVTTAKVSKEYAEKDNADAEKVGKPCVHFFTNDGRHIASVSNGICRSAKNLLACGIIPTAENPVKLAFTEIDTKNGKSFAFNLMK